MTLHSFEILGMAKREESAACQLVLDRTKLQEKGKVVP